MSVAGAEVRAFWSRLFVPGSGACADPIWPESAPGPWTSGASAGSASKSGGSATLFPTKGTLLSCPSCLIVLVGVQYSDMNVVALRAAYQHHIPYTVRVVTFENDMWIRLCLNKIFSYLHLNYSKRVGFCLPLQSKEQICSELLASAILKTKFYPTHI